MSALKTILVVDDNVINRQILSKILSGKYTVIQAENGQVALELLSTHRNEIAAIMLDIVMPVMDGYEVLEALRKEKRYSNLPVIVTTENSDSNNEIKVLSLGAWDFVSKPYQLQIIIFRLKNAIDRSQLTALKQLQYLAEYDTLTGLYNKTKFFDATRKMLDANREESFVFLRFDVDRFQLINSFFGVAEGDNLLIYIARQMEKDAKQCQKATYGRIESDIFALCVPYEQTKIEAMLLEEKEMLAKYNPNYDIVPSIGVYRIEDRTISVEEMFNRATLATKNCKGKYMDFYAYYDESMSIALTREQEIINEMNFALAHRQFEIYLQPKYNLHTNLPCGAEALVRWRHPQKGMLSPGEFIPVFERNGFIRKLDYYVWEETCKYIRSWIERGANPYPISVNVSRVNVYDPKLTETILELVNRYQLSPSLLHLELTESAYTDNPVSMKKTMNQLQSYGFVILMDDFGSGYSSLSLLKDIAVDILKIDMGFLSKTDIPGRSENIIASVIRMAKWLNIPVIAEGAETKEQVDFLRSVGCDYVQGYYFARPMPVKEYEELCSKELLDAKEMGNKVSAKYDFHDLFGLKQDMKVLFGTTTQAVVIYEFAEDHIEMIRVNDGYYRLLGHDDMMLNSPDIFSLVQEDCKEVLLQAFRTCVQTQGTTQCEYRRNHTRGSSIWLHTRLSYISTVANKHIVIGEVTDITMRKEIDAELQKYRTSLLLEEHDIHTILIVDDEAINRAIIKKILQYKFKFLEAENGEDAIKILEKKRNDIDLILLDIIMPKMDGKKFLQYKKNTPELDSIPVIMITSDDSPAQQISTLSLGANDYIVKPFIPEIVVRRVKNVLESNRRFREMMKEYNTISQQVKTDLMTGLFNRISAEMMITQYLESEKGGGAMLMIDIDHFKDINDSCGHVYGDKVIAAVARKLQSFFRKDDIVARMGGDEFAIFIKDAPDIELLKRKAQELCESMWEIEIDGRNAEITCSIGVAIVASAEHSFETLYRSADNALYNAKYRGRNTVSFYGKML